MSASPIITLGYGSTFGLPALIITLGYGLGVTPPATGGDTHDYPISKDDWRRYKKHLRKERQALERAQADKLAEAQDIRRTIDDIRNPKPPAEPEKPSLQAKKGYAPDVVPMVPPVINKKQQKKIQALMNEIRMKLAEAELLAEQARLIREEERRRQDEDDMRVIDRLLSEQIHAAYALSHAQ